MDLTKEVLNELLVHAEGLEKVSIETFLDVLSNTKSWKSIIPQEVAAIGGFVDMDFYDRIIFEIKGTEGELKEGLKKVSTEYVKSYPKAEYIILTTSSLWWIYLIKKPSLQKKVFESEDPSSRVQLSKIYIGRRENEVNRYLKQILREILTKEGYRIPARPEVLAVVFKKVTSFEGAMLEILSNHKSDELIRPLSESFTNIIEVLYNEPTEEVSYRLLAKHTILQMIVLACLTKALNKFEGVDPVKVCRGLSLDLDVSLPYLNWWYLIHSHSSMEKEIGIIENLSSEITKNVELIDWQSSGPEDVFRELYELFIEQDTRRAIGEYYTPLWLVEYAIERLKSNSVPLRDKLIFDPFCGSGTFLSMAFHRKVREGEDPEKAIEEVVGFDINPLAISLARAELILAYSKYSTEIPRTLIFHTDTLATMFQGQNILDSQIPFESPEFTYHTRLTELNHIQDSIIKEISGVHFEEVNHRTSDGSSNLIDILRIERSLGEIFRDVVGGEKNSYRDRLNLLFSDYLKQNRFGEHEIGAIFRKLLKGEGTKFIDYINQLLNKYGDGVWAATIASILAPLAIDFSKSDVVLTNPPWLQLSKFRPKYSAKIKSRATYLLKSFVKQGASEIVAGSDLASMALYGAMQNTTEAVAFIMPRESTFNYKTSQRSGLLLTYSVLKNFESRTENIELIDVDYDAFEHGNYPALLIVKMKNEEVSKW
jgi:hypothetical protein